MRFYVHSIQKHAADNALECDEFKQPYASFSHLWTRDIAGAVKDFLVEKAVPIEEEAAAAAEGEGAPKEEGKASSFGGALAPTPEPALADFDEQIDLYRRQALDIGALSTSATRGWLKLDAKPVKQALSTWVTKWKFAYTQHLQTSVIDRLSELKAFMEATVGGLATEVEPDDVAALVQAMTFIRDVRVRTDTIDALFEPLRGTVALLKKYSITLSESTMELLENAPFQWEDTKKATLNAREKLNPLQALQAEKIKEEAEDFGYRVSDFRKAFLDGDDAAPFKHECGEACYASLDRWHLKIDELEGAAATLNEKCALFDVVVAPYKEIKQCRQDILALKLVWDHVELVEHTFVDWRSTLWPAVDVDAMMLEANRLQKEVKANCPKVARSWDVYNGMWSSLQNMLVALPLVQDLRDEAMRERHWKKLMRICGKSFVMDEKLNLGVMLSLELHKFADPVAETVEQARMELKIDKQLSRIENTWMALQLEYEVFKTTGVMILKDASATIEALDDHEVALQTMMGNRFMAFFETQITTWKGKLSGVRAVLENWMEVQRQWCSLEAIFIGSEDIREQLPEDAKRFDGIDASFKEQMGVA